MEIGVTVPNHWGVPDPQRVVELGVLAEELDFDSVWVMEHFFNVGYVADRIGEGPYYHPLAIAAYLAAKTTRVRIGTSVLVLPFHNPFGLAKFASTLDHLSAGRLILGVGTGWLEAEFAVASLPMADRGAMSDEAIEVMRALWTGSTESVVGRHWSLSSAVASPRPLQPNLPLWIAGSSRAALQRAAELGDAWHPTSHSVTPERYERASAQIESMALAAGRPMPLRTLRVDVDFADFADTGDDGTRQAWERLVSRLRAYENVGVAHFVLAPQSGDTAMLERWMRTFASDWLPTLR